MRHRLVQKGRWIALWLALLASFGLLLGRVGPLAANEPAAWEALGPERTIDRLLTPTSGALFARAPIAERFPASELFRSHDGGLTWDTVPRPPDTDVLTVSPTDHELLFAVGKGGVFRSQDGGANWQRVSDRAEGWQEIEVSPADPAVLYGLTLTNPPAEYGRDYLHEFLVSQDGGASWEVVRAYRDRHLPGSRPCFYDVRALRPHAVDPSRVLTIEGCTDRGFDPFPRQSSDWGATGEPFPSDVSSLSWGVNAVVGGQGTDPGRWYVSVFRAGITYSRIHHSRVLRSDDDGLSWTPIFESDSGGAYPDTARPVDFVTRLAYNPDRADELYAIVEHREPQVGSSGALEHRTTRTRARRSEDGGRSWSDLGTGDLPSIQDLAVGVDGRYLFAATGKGVYRIPLSE